MWISAINSNQFRIVPFLTPPYVRSYWPQNSLRCPRVTVKSTSVFVPLQLIAVKFNWFNFLKAFQIILHSTPVSHLSLDLAPFCSLMELSLFSLAFHQLISYLCCKQPSQSNFYSHPAKNVQGSTMAYKHCHLKVSPLRCDLYNSMLSIILS